MIRRLLWWVGGCLGAVVLAGGLWWGVRWMAGEVAQRQSRDLVDGVREGVVPLGGERGALERAVALDPRNGTALRMLAVWQEAEGDVMEALVTRQRLAEAGAVSLEDVAAHFSLALRCGEFAMARKLADSFPPVTRHAMLGVVAMEAGKPGEAERELRAAAELDGTGKSRVELAGFLIAVGVDAEAMEILRNNAMRPDGVGAMALQLGLASGLLGDEEVQGWIEAMRSHPIARGDQLLVADMAEARLDPSRRSAMRAAERLAGGALPERIEAMRWAADIGEYAAAASLVQPVEVLGDPLLFGVSVHARSMVGGWREGPGDGGEACPAWLEHFMEAYALRDEGEEGDAVLMEGLAMAREESETMVQALGFLAAVGDNVLLERELKDFLAARPDDLDDVLRGVLPALRVHRDKERMFRVFEIATGGEHGILQPDLADEADRLALLLGRPVDVEAVVRRSKENNHRMTHALALLKQDDTHGAFTLLDSGRYGRPHRRLPARQKMVVASVLAGVGRRDEAQRLVATIPPREIRKEERRLFATQMARSPSIGSMPKDPRLVADSPRDRSSEMGDGGDEDGERPPDPTERVIAEILEGEEMPLGPDLTRSIVLEAMAEAAEEAGEGE